jgi:hypothetical protein
MQEIASMAGVELPEFLGKLKETQKTKSETKDEGTFPEVPTMEPETDI